MFLPHLKNRVQEPAVVVSAPVESAKPATVPEPAPRPIVATDPPRKDFSEVKSEPAPVVVIVNNPEPGEFREVSNGETLRHVYRFQNHGADHFGPCESCKRSPGSGYVLHNVYQWEDFTNHSDHYNARGPQSFWRGRSSSFICWQCAATRQATQTKAADDSPPVNFSEVKPERAPEPRKPEYRCPYAMTATRNGKTFTRIGHWQDMCAYYSDGETVYAVFGSTWTNSGELSVFRERFATHTRGELYPLPVETAAEPAPEPLPNFGDSVQTPDGRTGTMRGSGGMGSDRVQVENAAGNRSWHNRYELRRVATEPAPAPTVETATAAPPSGDFSDDGETFQSFELKESHVVSFGKRLESTRFSTIHDFTYRIEPRQDDGFEIVVTGPEGFTETIISGFYGFPFDSFDRTVSYAVNNARGRFVCNPETLDNGCQIEKRYHKRRGVFVYVVTLPEPVKGSRFDTLDNRAKKSGGWYAREYRPEYQRGGFMFPDRRNADRFAKEFTPSAKVATMRHTDTKPEQAPETPSGDFSDSEPSAEYSARIGRNVDHIARMTTAARLEELANGMQKTIDEKTRPMTQNWTVKRGREYNSRCHDGRHYQRVQEALRVLAAHWRAGTIPDSMQQLKAKSAILPLLSCRWDSCSDRGTDEFTNNSPLAVELRELIEANRTGEHREQLAAAKRAAEIKAAEDNLRLRNVPGFFPTPPALVDRMVEQAQFPESPSEDFSVLEPSAGIGSIADGIASEIPPSRIKCVEISSACCSVLELKGYNVGEGDFLQIPAGERFDRILMNPPFENGQDIDHVRHAFSLLKSGGRLVAIMSEGSLTTTKRKVTEFTEWLDSLSHYHVSESIRGAFDNATAFRSTGVTVRLVTIDKD